MLYLDTSYLLKLYVNEPGSAEVMAWATGRSGFVCCAHGRVEFVSALKRQQREGVLSQKQVSAVIRRLAADERARLVEWLPVDEALIWAACLRVAALDAGVFLRSADALHLVAAAEAGAKEIHSHDRHLLAAAQHFGLRGVDVIAGR
jgi:predicted nucleic acid-binding protein